MALFTGMRVSIGPAPIAVVVWTRCGAVIYGTDDIPKAGSTGQMQIGRSQYHHENHAPGWRFERSFLMIGSTPPVDTKGSLALSRGAR